MKYLILLVHILFCFYTSTAQKVNYIEMPEWDLPYEISSMDRKGDVLYLMSESCELLFLYDIDKDSISSIKLDLGDVDVEGVCIFNNYLFFTNESDNTIHILNLETQQELTVETEFKTEANKSLNSGLEGIEITPDGNILYVLREKSTKDPQGYLYCFNVSISEEVCKLDLVQKTKLKLEGKQRYAGLALSNNNEVLSLLRTDKGGYYIDRMILNGKGLPEKQTYESNDFATLDISKKVNAKEPVFHSNMEGIATAEDGLFLVSDNLESKKSYCPEDGRIRKGVKKTLFMKIQF